MKEYEQILEEFSHTVDKDLFNFVENMGRLQANLNRVNMKKVGEQESNGGMSDRSGAPLSTQQPIKPGKK